MQVLFAWKADGFSEQAAIQHWNSVTDAWKTRYQPLVDRELRLMTIHSGKLFLGLLFTPDMFREWQEFYDDDVSAVAWVGIAHNLLETISPKTSWQQNEEFLKKLHVQGDKYVRELDGHYVVSVLNRQEHTLRIIVNSLGFSQCFQTHGQYGLAVGTRIAPLLDLVGRSPVPKRSAFIHLFALSMCFGPDTVFEGVERVEPGHEVILREEESAIQTRCHTPLELILGRSREFGSEYLHIGSESITATIQQQLRHSRTPLMNLTGGMDSRVMVSTAASLGYHPDCDVSGLPEWRELSIAGEVAEALNVRLHRLCPNESYAENLEQTLQHWGLWTEGMVSAELAFSRSTTALSPQLRQFYAPYTQRFTGLAGELGRNAGWGTEMLLDTPSADEVYTRMRIQFTNEFLSRDDCKLLFYTLRTNLTEGHRLGFQGHQLFNYVLWNELGRRAGSAVLDMQHLGRYVFASLNHQTLASVFFAMTAREKLQGAWHLYHLRRVAPDVLNIRFLKPPILQGDEPVSREYRLQKKLIGVSPSLYYTAKHVRDSLLLKYAIRTMNQNEDRAGSYFYPYLKQLLFSGEPWWPTVISYKQGQRVWDRFVKYQETPHLWSLVTIELWAQNFLQ